MKCATIYDNRIARKSFGQQKQGETPPERGFSNKYLRMSGSRDLDTLPLFSWPATCPGVPWDGEDRHGIVLTTQDAPLPEITTYLLRQYDQEIQLELIRTEIRRSITPKFFYIPP